MAQNLEPIDDSDVVGGTHTIAASSLVLHLASLSFWVDAGKTVDEVCDRIDLIARSSKHFQTPEVRNYLRTVKALLFKGATASTAGGDNR